MNISFLDEMDQDLSILLKDKNISISKKIFKLILEINNPCKDITDPLDWSIRGIWFSNGLEYVEPNELNLSPVSNKKEIKEYLGFISLFLKNKYLYQVFPNKEKLCINSRNNILEKCDGGYKKGKYGVIWRFKPGFRIKMLYKFIKKENIIKENGDKAWIYRFKKINDTKQHYRNIPIELSI